MIVRCVQAALLAGLAVAAPVAVLAQQQFPADRFPSDLPPQQPAQQPPGKQAPPHPAAQPPAQPPKPTQPARAVACSGAFAKDSSHLKLATLFGSQNLTFGEVDGPEGTKLMASILFPKDPSRRLEVLWNNEAGRSQTALVVINGRSTWTAPKGLRLGLALEAAEKLNGRPFRLKGFGPDGASVADWQGGAFDKLPGGCKLGLRFVADPKAPEEARSEVSGGEKDFVSSDALVRAVKPKVAEIIVGY